MNLDLRLENLSMSQKKGVTRKDIVVDYKRAEIEKNTPEWAQRPSDYVNAGKSKKEEGQTVGDEIVNRAINGGNADSETSVNELIGEGVPEDASRAFIEAIEKGNISSIVNLSDTERKQIDRMLERTDQEPKRVQAAIETLMRTKGFSTSQSEIIARDFIGKRSPGINAATTIRRRKIERITIIVSHARKQSKSI